MYSIFLFMMRTLTHVFGYMGALKFKDAADFLIGTSIGCIFLSYLMSGFYREVDIDKKLRADKTIQRVDFNPPAFSANPQNRIEVMESFFGYLRIRHTKKKCIMKKDSRRFSIFITVIFVILIFLEWVLIAYDYFPGQ